MLLYKFLLLLTINNSNTITTRKLIVQSEIPAIKEPPQETCEGGIFDIKALPNRKLSRQIEIFCFFQSKEPPGKEELNLFLSKQERVK